MILQKLRSATRLEHERVEAHIDLLGRSWSEAFYCLLLQKFYGFYSMIEPPIFAWSQWEQAGLDVEKRRKVGSLLCDLKSLGLDSAAIRALPCCTQVPNIGTFAEALGCAYVLEGATLGGQIITRHLRSELTASEYDFRFFNSYGPAVGIMWQEFVTFLNCYSCSPEDEVMLIASACATFKAFDEWLSDIL